MRNVYHIFCRADKNILNGMSVLSTPDFTEATASPRVSLRRHPYDHVLRQKFKVVTSKICGATISRSDTDTGYK
jgi:hypothetical protein